ncbi:unnamed protein product [Owenia fusiformis]|uniref:Uncharacterized protein n=1 Tax=Owenia fusiformis TaxID=6347 RepID=A0A8J1U5U3_OWEFU|nr:unnamed protein product [Owenia fusiformis]
MAEGNSDTCQIQRVSSPSRGPPVPDFGGSLASQPLCIKVEPGTIKSEHETRKNKRKMSSPRRRTDFSIKRFCPESPASSTSDAGGSTGEADYEHVNRDGEDRPDPTRGSLYSSPDTSQDEPVNMTVSRKKQDEPHTQRRYIPTIPENFRVPVPHPQSFYSGMGPYTTPRFGYPGSEGPSPRPGSANSSFEDDGDGRGKRGRKNYKNMTRERRVEANARERSRVHTISAAFDSLRRAVPSYSYNQKLSKLAILRIACSYILALARLADLDYSHDQSRESFADCVDSCTNTIQTEGRVRRRH